MKDLQKIIHAIIACYNANFWLNEARNTKRYRQSTKNFLSRAVQNLTMFESNFDEIDNFAAEALQNVADPHHEYLKKIATISHNESGELSFIIDAYRKDSKSVLGISKKVMR